MATEHEIDGFLNRAAAAVGEVVFSTPVAAMSREAVKDVRNTLNEVFFGNSERGGELGAPMNPLASDIVASRQTEGMPSPGEIANEPLSLEQLEPDHGQQVEHDRGR